MIRFICIAVWVGCAIVDYGLMFAYYQNKYPTLATRDRRRDCVVALLSALLGPCSLITTLISFNRGQYGFKLR